jgi:predicted ArsR family transcriptional regulator
MDHNLDEQLAGIAGLADPIRRALYRHVAERGVAVARDEAARATGISRTLAGYHLDKLVDDGLLEAHFERRSGRGGPGAGRPAKLYRRARGEVAASLPPRAYHTAAHLLAETVERTGADLELQAAAREDGREAGRRLVGAGPAPEVEAALAARGYEPYRDGAALRLRNCPFANLAGEFPALVCGMNLALVEGLLEGMGQPPGRAAMAPAPGRCCVAVLDRPDASKDNQD